MRFNLCFGLIGWLWLSGLKAATAISEDLTDVRFILYTRQQVIDLPMDLSDFDLNQTDFDPGRGQTIVILHGFRDSLEMAEAFVPDLLYKEDLNVIFVLWDKLATGDNYIVAASNAIKVGELAANFLIKLHFQTGLEFKRVYGIGFSLGAQSVGKLGETVFATTGKKLGRITGLDPARPGFTGFNSLKCLSKEDATFVDVIHTSAGSLTGGYTSIMAPLGHVDFYPSGGHDQPGCERGCVIGCSFSQPVEIVNIVDRCSHSRSYHYYIESINSPREFVGRLCLGWIHFNRGMCDSAPSAILGFNLKPESVAPGSYYLHVSASAPFALGPRGAASRP